MPIEVEAVRKDRTGLKAGGKWYSNKAEYLDDEVMEILDKVNRGDKVEVMTNDKGFLERVDIIERGSGDYSSPKSSGKPKSSGMDKNKMFKLSYAKDLAVAIVNSVADKDNILSDTDINQILTDCVDAVNKAEKKIE